MKIIAANFKTNHNRYSTKEYIDFVEEFISKENIGDKVFVFPPSTALLRQRRNIIIGAQNAYPIFSGSFTGEIGITQLDEFDIKTILIGHSERRHILKESNEFIKQKYDFFKEHKFCIFFCIGEPLEVREKGFDEVLKYLDNQLKDIDLEYDKLVVAYEPVWAIGTGVSATKEQIIQTHNALKEKYNFKYLLYGGSVKPENIKDILSINSVDGALIGTASWDKNKFCKMLKRS
jgi:triosephosphate isomerase